MDKEQTQRIEEVIINMKPDEYVYYSERAKLIC